MSRHYEEIIDGLSMLRLAPGPRHEQVCERLHARVAAGLEGSSVVRLLPVRSPVAMGSNTTFRPDLAVMTLHPERLWLAAEIIHAGDHQPDTVTKKTLYEDLRIPRLWMVDPRYDNVEVYHATSYGLMLKGILAGREVLEDKFLPRLQLAMTDLFAA